MERSRQAKTKKVKRMALTKFSKILIIVIRYIPTGERQYYEFPLGLAYVSSSLKRAGYDVDVLNLNHYDESQLDLIRDFMTRNKYGHVLTGGLSAHYQQVKSVVDDVRKSDPAAKVIVGGGVMTATPELMYRYIQPDYMVLGEGEITIVELIDALNNGGKNLESIDGIGYRGTSGEIIVTQGRAPISDLDTIPWPDLEGFQLEAYLDMQRPNDNLYLYPDDKPRFYPIISSRGCPFNCTFCYHPLGQKYRSRSIDDFIAEVEYVTEKYQVNNLAIFDELLSANRERLFQICGRLKKIPRRLHWMCQLRVDQIDAEMLRTMKEAGCFLISYGFESASDIVLKSMNKHISKTQIEKALHLTREAGICSQGYFIFGDPAETSQTAYETLDFWEKHRDYHITMGYIRPYPGSPLWDREMALGHLGTDKAQLELIDKCVYAPPNMTQMNDKEWFRLQKDVQKAIIKNDHFGKLISSEKTGDNTYSITVRCPHCGQITTYKNFNQRILGIFKMSCRHCNQEMNMTPLAFTHVRDDYERNIEVYRRIISGYVSVTVTPCMSEAEFSAMAELALDGAKIDNFMDISDAKEGKMYLGKKILKRNAENIRALGKDNFFLIPLTRFANRITKHLLSLGVDKSRICRLDEVIIGTGDRGYE